MTSLQRITIAFLTVAMLAMGGAQAASTANYSDYWWTENESGWGMSAQQQADVLFISLAVYGADNKPTWFTAAAFNQGNSATGHVVFTGDLYLTNGPHFGATWNAAALGYRKVGMLTFDATTANNATLAYTVDGTPVEKNVTRLLLGYENLSGSYYGAWKADRSGCPDPPIDDAELRITIRHNADNTVAVTLLSLQMYQYDFRGTYSQSGHLGQIATELVSPDFGSVTFFEIEKTGTGFTGRFTGSIGHAGGNTCQITNGRIGGFLR